MFKVNNKKTPERRRRHYGLLIINIFHTFLSSVSIVDFEEVSVYLTTAVNAAKLQRITVSKKFRKIPGKHLRD